jgi:hypothetical protein
MLFNILKIATLVCASSAFVKAAPLADASDIMVPEDNALSQLAEQIINLEGPTYNVSSPATLEARDINFTNCGCAKSGQKYWHADMDKVRRSPFSPAQRSAPSSFLADIFACIDYQRPSLRGRLLV